jgi:L-fuconate dehydratase
LRRSHGVVHIATGAVSNAIWDLYAKSRSKPLWKLIADFTPGAPLASRITLRCGRYWPTCFFALAEEFVKSVTFRYITDFLTPDEALNILKDKEAGKKEREATMIKRGYPAYTTSVGWLGYSDDKVRQLTKEALNQGFNHFKLKVGANVEDDLRRGRVIREIIDDPKNLPEWREKITPESVAGKNASAAGTVLMVDANQVWDVAQAIDYVKQLKPLNPWSVPHFWCTPRSTASWPARATFQVYRGAHRAWRHLGPRSDPQGPEAARHRCRDRRARVRFASSRARLRVDSLLTRLPPPSRSISHNRMVFKQLLQAEAIDVCQIDSCRLAGVNEVLSVLLMAAKAGVPVCPHAGGVGLCEMVVHLSLIDYICVSGSCERNVLEWVDEWVLALPSSETGRALVERSCWHHPFSLSFLPSFPPSLLPRRLHNQYIYPVSINKEGRYNVPQDPKGGYSITFKPEAIEHYSFPGKPGSYWEAAAKGEQKAWNDKHGKAVRD